MNTVRKIIVTAMAVICLSFVAMPTYAAPFSYYDMISKIADVDAQKTFAQNMMRSYRNGLTTLKPLAEKYGHYSWAAGLVETVNFYETEIHRFEELIGAKQVIEVTEVKQTYTYNEHEAVTETPEVSTRTSTESETTEDYTVNVYEDVVITFTKTVTTKKHKGTFTTTHWSCLLYTSDAADE